MKATFHIAKRYLIAKSSQNVINIINRITALVVVIVGTALFVVLAGYEGLKSFTLSFSTYFDPDLKILPRSGKFITFSDAQLNELAKNEGIAYFSKVLEEQVFLSHKQKNYIARIKGVDTNYPLVNPADSLVVLGMWDLQSPKMVAGITIFNALGLNFMDTSSPLQLVVPRSGKGSITQTSRPYRETYGIISGVYQITEDLDKKYVFTSLEQAQELLGLDSLHISAIEIKKHPQADENKLIEQIQNLFQGEVIIKNRVQINDALYRMLNTENIAIYLIFILVLIIALFNLVGAIIMMILDKKEDLKTLYALGLNIKQLCRIFFLQGTMVSVMGAFLGVCLGAIIVLLQQYFNFVMISSTLAYPVEIKGFNVFAVFAIITILGFLASWLASSRITKKMIDKQL
ncbi:Lipoprotein-releasing system transmembrane protein lolC [Capnocytophaga canimorsus]|uniref:Lipoprotein-releasing system transmembrane protein lolC n=1 Tax=Capnocytophaga canimorsus TaxID=28188 RepID=A0A0B7H7F9_9FLAO|nr:FtsX-like permease family protein [Capnocytophaga canimorsus]PJI83871.1 lipoprotein-releasing system permease protein [Capnocytophaga canimorsus]CEN33568.1 Lipoprotein-releasing system transmembrane protein lolC [Capnocytophaga canimorsus]STA72202.1 Lipoprotein-releasing system transmembrane protein lolE [Capnocytophaga canimorsus]